MTEPRHPYVTAIPVISADEIEAAAFLADVPVVGTLESETRNGRQACAATPSDFLFWAARAKALWGRKVRNGR